MDLGDGRWIVFYRYGSPRFVHPCGGGEQGDVRLNPRHHVTVEHPLTIWPPILCVDCGTHGHVTGGDWVDL